MPERPVQPLDRRRGQRRPQDRLDVGFHMRPVAGAEQDDVGALLVAGIAIGRIGDAGRAALAHEEGERVAVRPGIGQHRRIEPPVLDQLREHRAAVGVVAEDVAHHEHQQRADAAPPRDRKHLGARALVHQAVGQHDDLPWRLQGGAREHRLLRIARPRLGEADMAHLALLLEPQQRRRQRVAMMLVGGRADRVEMEDVDMVEPEPLQRRLDLPRHRLRRVLGLEQRLGRDHEPVTVIGLHRRAHDLLGPVGLGRVEEVHPQIDRRPRDPHALLETRPAPQPEPTVAAAAEPGNGDGEAGVSEGVVVHNESCSL